MSKLSELIVGLVLSDLVSLAESVTGAVKPSFLYGMRKSASLLASSNIVIPVSVQFPPLNFGGWKVPSYMPSRLVPETLFKMILVCF